MAMGFGGIKLFNKTIGKNSLTIEKLQQMKPKYTKLCGASYYHGGGMEGSSDRRILEFDKEGNLTYTTEYAEENGLPEMCHVYKVDESELEKLDAYVKEYNLSVWDELPDEDMQVLDAPGTSINLTFYPEEGDKYRRSMTINYDKVFPEDGYEVVNKFVSMLSSLAIEDNLIDHYVRDYEDNIIRCGKDVENSDEEIDKLLMGYWNNAAEQRVYVDYGEEILVIRLGDVERREYLVKEKIHENYRDLDSSWYCVLVNKEDENDLAYITIDKDKFYIEDSNGNTAVLERN